MNGTGWDIHNEGYANQHLLIQELDTAVAALIRDLKQKKLLDKTLIAIGTEFGRPAGFDGRGGRGHQGTAFSLVLAGGGLNHCGAYGTTDELAKSPVDNPVPLVDFHATIHAAMGIDPSKELMDGSRPLHHFKFLIRYCPSRSHQQSVETHFENGPRHGSNRYWNPEGKLTQVQVADHDKSLSGKHY